MPLTPAEKQAAYRKRKEYVERELEITRRRYSERSYPGAPSLALRLERTEEYALKWLAGEIGLPLEERK